MARGYRALGADLPRGDRRRAHGVAMEGYFWRLADPGSGRVVVALCGVCRGPDGARWANVALAAHPGRRLAWADLSQAGADPHGLGVWAEGERGSFRADAHRLVVDLGPDARLDVSLTDRGPRRQPALGGVGAAHLIPGLGQYWDPHLMGARASGCSELAGETLVLRDVPVYAEKNWSARGGFPGRWWWGQASAFARPDVVVAFAGGELTAGPLTTEATAVVVRLGERIIRLGNPVLAPVVVTAADGRWSLRARGPRHGIELEGRAPGDTDLVELPVPDPAARRSVPAARQHLAGTVTLHVRARGRVVFAGESPAAGLELGSRPG